MEGLIDMPRWQVALIHTEAMKGVKYLKSGKIRRYYSLLTFFEEKSVKLQSIFGTQYEEFAASPDLWIDAGCLLMVCVNPNFVRDI